MLNKLIIIRGGGDVASGVAVRLFRAGFKVIILEIMNPLAVRLPVSFASAVYKGTCVIEGIEGVLAETYDSAEQIINNKKIAILIDPMARTAEYYNPAVLIDAIMAKSNLGTKKEQAPLVIGIGPGFSAGTDVDVVIETKVGHTLGRTIYNGTAMADTGLPGEIKGETDRLVLRAPTDGKITPFKQIGDMLNPGDIIAKIEDTFLKAELKGVLRGLISPNVTVTKELKIGDIDPRGIKDYCFTISDKSLSIAGGVLEAVCSHFSKSNDKILDDDDKE